MPQTISGLIQNPGQHGNANYPFNDNASMKSRSGEVIPKEAFVDARIYVPGGIEGQHISRIEVDGGNVKVHISDTLNELATGTYSGSGDTITLIDKYDREVGLLLGNPTLLAGLAPSGGVLEFSETALAFVPVTTPPQPQLQVTGVLDANDNLLAGDVWLVGEKGVVLAASGNTITINVVGDPFFTRRACTAEVTATSYQAPRPLKSIIVKDRTTTVGTLTPDTHGNVQFEIGQGETAGPGTGADDNVIRMQAIGAGIMLSVVGSFQ